MDFYFRRWSLQLVLLAAAVGSAIFIENNTQAQVVPDNTLGSENSAVTNTGNIDTISGGATRGANLFHSFEQFSVQNGRIASFDNGADIQNIITRVTGGSISTIDGILAAGGTANLFLLNPNGIVFGQNARLNIGGSFIGTTASSINFADGTQFSATPGTGAPLLTVNVPIGLQFGTGAGSIINRSTSQGLQVQPGRTLGLVGGNVNLEGGNLTARGGRIELGAVAAPGVVGLNTDNNSFRFSFPTDLTLGDISLTNTALVDTRASGGGSIAVNTRNLNLTGSVIVAGIGAGLGATDAVAGDIDINAQGTVTIDGAGKVPDGIFRNGILNSIEAGAQGKGGEIRIKAKELSLDRQTTIDTSTFGLGSAGNILVQVDDALSLASNSYIFSSVVAGAAGNGGTIDIQAGTLSLTGGSEILAPLESATTDLPGGRGNGGKIVIDVRNAFSASGSSSNGKVLSGVFTTVDSGAEGRGGDIEIQAGSLSLSDGAVINASTSGQGDAGDIFVQVDESIDLANSSSDRVRSGVFTTVGTKAEGKGGDIEIKARSLFLSDGAVINASTSGQGDAGDIFVQVDDVVSLSSSYIFSSVAPGAEGNGGTIDIQANSLSLTDGAQIIAQVESSEAELPGRRGNGGKVIIDVRDAFSASGNGGVFTAVGAGAVGQGGDIEIKARSLSLDNDARIDASTLGKGNAGNIFLRINDAISLSRGYIISSVASGAEGNGGTIDIRAGTLSLTSGGQIIAQVRTAENGLPGGLGNGGKVAIEVRDAFSASGSSGSFSSGVFATLGSEVEDTTEGIKTEGKGGDIEIKAGSLSLDQRATIDASTFGLGDAGNILLRVNGALSLANDSTIFSSVTAGAEGNGGTIDIKAGALSLTGGSEILTPLEKATDSLPGGQGKSGKVIIDVRDAFSASGSSSDGLRRSGVFTTVDTGAVGEGGDIEIKAGSLSLTNGAEVNASIFGMGNAGSISITADDSLFLDGRSGIFSGVAETGTGIGGDIRLQASNSLRLRNGSRISTSAGGTQPGNGGNITIDSPLIIANSNGNNDITANAFRGSGGRIEINAQSIFVLSPRNLQELQSLAETNNPTELVDFLNSLSTNDVAAISFNDPALSGTVTFNAADIDPSRDLVELPTGLVDASGLVATGCPAGAENRFAVTGRGGLPPAPGDKLSPDALLTDWASLPSDTSRTAVESSPEAVNTTPTPLVEADSWQFSSKGEIVLTANASNTPNSFGTTPTSCSGS